MERKPLPAHLVDMTQEKWDKLTPAMRLKMRDMSEVHPLLHTYLGQKVKVTPKREFGPSTFRVGITTGWRPVLLAMRSGANGSSDIVSAGEIFSSIGLAK